MNRLVTSMVFCEAPVDFAYSGTAAATVAKPAADARAGGDVVLRPVPAVEEAAAGGSVSSLRGRQVECAPAFDGLNWFETLVMPSPVLAVEKAAAGGSASSPLGRQVECAPAFDGLNWLETLVMPSR